VSIFRNLIEGFENARNCGTFWRGRGEGCGSTRGCRSGVMDSWADPGDALVL